MLKVAMAASILVGLFGGQSAFAQQTVDAGFGGPPIPIEETMPAVNSTAATGGQTAPAGPTQPQAVKIPTNRSLPNLPKVTTGLNAAPGTEIKDLPGARYGIISQPGGLEAVPPARYATLSDGNGLGDAKSAAAAATNKAAGGSTAAAPDLPPARYATLSDEAPAKASEGF